MNAHISDTSGICNGVQGIPAGAVSRVRRGERMWIMANMRLTREQQQAKNRALLLQAAERVFAERGVAGASLDDVALEAGFTKGAVYSNFRNKGELILEVIRNRQTDTPEARKFAEVLTRVTDAQARLEAWCDLWIATARSGDRAAYARIVFDFIPFALRDPELTRQFITFVTPGEETEAASPIPPDGPLSHVPSADQFRILTALDLGLSALMLIDPEGVSPELYRTAVKALAGGSGATGSDQAE